MTKAISKRKEELRLQTPEGLKEMYPLYPIVRKTEKDKEFTFSTLIRKWYKNQYYLIPIVVTETNEAKAIHNLHAYVYRYFMLGVLTKEDVIDNNQVNEKIRLKELK